MYKSAKRSFALKKTAFAVTITASVADEFNKYCDDNDYIKQKLIELILEEFLEKYGVKPKDGSGSPE